MSVKIYGRLILPSLPPSLPPSFTYLYLFRSSASVPAVSSPRVAHISRKSCSDAASTPSREEERGPCPSSRERRRRRSSLSLKEGGRGGGREGGREGG